MELLDNFNWELENNNRDIKTIEAHTLGEPLRVIISGLPEIKGNTVLERRRYFREHYDNIRTALIFEPRGHADMYGAILTPPNTPDGDFGVFFIHNEGYSTMCGHAIIALTTVVLDTGMIKKKEKNPIIKIDAPAGRVYATAFRDENNKVKKVSFLNVPSYLYLRDKSVFVQGIGDVKFDVAFGGAFYAFVDAKKLNLPLNTENYNKIIDYGKRIKKAVMENFEIKHPFEDDLSFLYGTIFTGDALNPENHSRNVCIFADGEVDRSPTGTGVSARAAINFAKNEIKIHQSITIESILNTTMDVEVVETTNFGNFDAVIPKVTGNAFITGQNKFYFNDDDILDNGFIFR